MKYNKRHRCIIDTKFHFGFRLGHASNISVVGRRKGGNEHYREWFLEQKTQSTELFSC